MYCCEHTSRATKAIQLDRWGAAWHGDTSQQQTHKMPCVALTLDPVGMQGPRGRTRVPCAARRCLTASCTGGLSRKVSKRWLYSVLRV